MASVNVNSIRVKKGQLAKLIEAVGGTDLQDIELRPTAVGDKSGLLAVVKIIDQTGDYEEQYLVIGDGVVKL